MKSLPILASALIAALVGLATLPQAAQACHPWNPFCNKPKDIEDLKDDIEKIWVDGRDATLEPFKGHICKQYLLNVKRGRRGGQSAMTRFPIATQWLINSNQFSAAELRNVRVYISSLIINAPVLVFGGDIYIRGSDSRTYQTGSMKTALMLAHEMEHVRQFKRFGTTEKFCKEYESQVASHGNFVDFHLLGGLEVSAGQTEYRFARWLLDSTRISEMQREHNVPRQGFKITSTKGLRRTVWLPSLLPTMEDYERFVDAGNATVLTNQPVPDRSRPGGNPRPLDPGYSPPAPKPAQIPQGNKYYNVKKKDGTVKQMKRRTVIIKCNKRRKFYKRNIDLCNDLT